MPNEYSDIVNKYKGQGDINEDAFAKSQYAASQREPEQYANVIKTANKLQIAPLVVEPVVEEAQKQASVKEQENEYSSLIKNYKKTTKYLSNPDNASVSKDDLDTLKKMEDAAADHSFAANMLSTLGAGALNIAKGTAQSLGMISPASRILMGSSANQRVRDSLSFAEKEQVQFFINNPVTRSLDAGVKNLSPTEMSADIIEEAKNGNIKKAGRVAAYQIAFNLPQMALTAINPAAGLALITTSGSGSKFSENIEKGIAPDLATVNALVTGGIEGGIESMGGVGSPAFKQIVKNTVANLGEATSKEVFKDAFKHIFKTAGQEGSEEFVTSVAQDLIDYGMGVNENAIEGIVQRAANAFIVGAGAGGVTSGAAQSVELARYKMLNSSAPSDLNDQMVQASNKQKAQSVVEYLKSYVADRKESKTFKRLPEKYAEAHQSHVEGTPLAELAVDVDAFNEVVFNQDKTKSPSEIAASMGILEKWELAQQSGSDIVLTPQDLSKMSDEVINALSGDFKTSGMSKSANDIKLDQEAMASTPKEIQEQANSEAIQSEQVRTRITQDVTQQLVETGLYNPQDARVNAQAISSFFNQLAVREGTKAEDLYKKYAPKIIKAASGPQKQGFVSKLKDSIQGSYTPEGRVIQLLQARDFSTFVHESGHFFLDIMQQVQADANASKSIKDDFSLIQKYVGSKDGNLTSEQHEKFTEAFVNYLQTGKAPSSALKKAFLTFKNWLLSVYKGMRTSPDVSPEIRGVFDRMLATQEEMAELRENYDNTMFSSGVALGMEGKELEKYEAQLAEAREAVSDEMEKAAITKVNKELSSEFKQVRELIEKEKTQEADRMMVFKVIEDIKNTNMLGKFNSADIEKLGLIDVFPKQYMKKGGTPIAGLASVYGYNSEFEMLKDIVDHPDKGAYIWDETNNEIVRSYPDLYPVFDLSEDAVRAVHGDKREKILRMQMDFLMKKTSSAVKGMAKSLIKRTPPRKAVQAQAENIISQQKIQDIKPYLYRRAEVKFSKLAGELFAKGDFEGAFDAKRKEYLNFELYNKAQEALDSKQNDDNFRKFFKKDEDISKTRDLNYVNGARAILSLWDYGGDKKTLQEIIKPIQSYDPEAYAGLSEMISDSILNAKPADQATYGEYQAMRDVVNSLWSLAKSTKEKTVGDRKVSQQEVIETSGKEIQKLIPESGQKIATQSQTYWEEKKGELLASEANFRRVESWALSIGQDTWNAIFRPVSDASVAYRSEQKVKLKQLKDIFEKNNESFKGKPVVGKGLNEDGTDHVFQRSELMMALLHSGNQSNLAKLLVGRGKLKDANGNYGKAWGSLNEDGSLDSSRWNNFLQQSMANGTITKKDMDMVQQIWDLNESLKPAAQKAHKEMYGYYFSEITASPIETPWGTYKGGYIPAKLDVNGTKDIALRKQMEDIEKENSTYQFPTTGRGFTKKRKENFHGPLSLDMGMLPNHIGQVLRFTHLEPTIKETTMLLKNPEYKALLQSQDENSIQHMLMPWLETSATQKVVKPSDSAAGRLMDKGASFLRNAAAVQIMLGNIVNASQQVTGLIIANSKVNKKYLRSAMLDYISKNGQAQNISELSPFMKELYDGSSFQTQQELEAILLDSGVFKDAQNFTKRHTYVLQTIAQNFVNTVVWNGAFNQYMAQNPNATQADAVAYADSVIRTTQGTQNPEDVSNWETGTATQRLFRQFLGYFNMVYNLNKSEYQKIQRDMLPDKKQRLFHVYMTAFALPAFVAALITKGLGPDDFDKDDDGYLDDILMSFFGSQLQQATAIVPIPHAGTAMAAVYGQFTDARYDDRLNISAGLSGIDNVLRAARETGNYAIDPDSDKGIQAVAGSLETLGFFLQLPVKPVTQRIKYLDKEDEPTARGIIIGR